VGSKGRREHGVGPAEAETIRAANRLQREAREAQVHGGARRADREERARGAAGALALVVATASRALQLAQPRSSHSLALSQEHLSGQKLADVLRSLNVNFRIDIFSVDGVKGALESGEAMAIEWKPPKPAFAARLLPAFARGARGKDGEFVLICAGGRTKWSCKEAVSYLLEVRAGCVCTVCVHGGASGGARCVACMSEAGRCMHCS
jgi:hypothetical protein